MNTIKNSIRANPEQLALREDKKSSTHKYEREAASLKVKNMTPIDQFFKPEDIIYTYTSKQAVEDAILFDLDQVRKYLPKNPFKYATVNLLTKGYFSQEDAYGNFKVKIPNVIDLIMGALMIYCRKPADDYFCSGQIELPTGKKQKIFIAQNESGAYTIMLPEDY